MTTRDHTHYRDDIGAYLLGALTDLESQAFEQHIVNCAECRAEIEDLRPAADALPRSVEQIEPPPELKAVLMEIVEGEAREAAPEKAAARTRRRPLRERLRIPAMRPVLVMGALLLGLVAGFAVAQLGNESDRTVVATVDQSRLPRASAELQVEDEGKNGAILRVRDMPTLEEDQVYQAWIQRDGGFVAQPTVVVASDGAGAVAVPDDLTGAEAVLVTRERRGGARAPTEQPVMSVPL